MAILSFSLRFYSAFKKHCKTRLKIKIPRLKRDTLHTCSHEKRNFENQIKKSIVVRTRVQSVGATHAFYCGFIANSSAVFVGAGGPRGAVAV